MIIWMDTETTGLDAERGALLEVAALVTDDALTPRDDGVSVTIHADAAQLLNMDDDARDMHTRSGLLEEVAASEFSLREAEEIMVDYLRSHVAAKTAPMAGSNIKFDRRWLDMWMPTVHDHAHYRDVCVSTITETTRRFFPKVFASAPGKSYKHRAMADVHESIDEYRHYLHGLGWLAPSRYTPGVVV